MPLRHSKGDFKRQKDIFVLKLDNRRVRFVIFCCEFCGQNFVECRAFFSHRAIVPKTKGVKILLALFRWLFYCIPSSSHSRDAARLTRWTCLSQSVFLNSSRSVQCWLDFVSIVLALFCSTVRVALLVIDLALSQTFNLLVSKLSIFLALFSILDLFCSPGFRKLLSLATEFSGAKRLPGWLGAW